MQKFNASNVLRGGKLGVALMPGSYQVLDRDTGTLVECTQQLCPYAEAVEVSVFKGVQGCKGEGAMY